MDLKELKELEDKCVGVLVSGQLLNTFIPNGDYDNEFIYGFCLFRRVELPGLNWGCRYSKKTMDHNKSINFPEKVSFPPASSDFILKLFNSIELKIKRTLNEGDQLQLSKSNNKSISLNDEYVCLFSDLLCNTNEEPYRFLEKGESINGKQVLCYFLGKPVIANT